MGASALAVTASTSRGRRAASVLGDLNERRVLRAARRIPAWWFLGAWRTRHGSLLDRLGWDIVIEAEDLGRIVLQVKSSERRAAAFVERGKGLRLRAPIHTIVVTRHTSDAEIFGLVLGTCIRAREEALAAGLTADDPRLCARTA